MIYVFGNHIQSTLQMPQIKLIQEFIAGYE